MPHRAAQAEHLSEGDMVMCSDGSVGMLCELRAGVNLSTVKFGADGPFQYFWWRDIRRATGKEIFEAGLSGVGCTPDQAQAVTEYKRSLRTVQKQRKKTS